MARYLLTGGGACSLVGFQSVTRVSESDTEKRGFLNGATANTPTSYSLKSTDSSLLTSNC